MAAADKDTIYIDIDDEITGIIDKLRTSSGKVVALVLPKRAAVFQSIVNMKLLKRAADQDKKNLVLITTEAGLLPLAGAAGVHVAKSLTSKPEIPAAPTSDDTPEEVDESAEPEDEAPAVAGDAPVGDLAGLPAAAAAADEVETLELDNGSEEDAADEPKPRDFTPPKKSKDNKLHVPNFERFRTLLIIGGALLLLLIVGLVFAVTKLPKATVTIHTDATKVNANLNLNLSTAAKTLDISTDTVPAKLVQQQKTYTEQVATTGQKNEGDRATGTVVVTNCDSSDVTIPKGSALISSGNTYITQQSVTVPDSNFTSPGSGSKCKDDGKASVNITAQSGGASYNTPAGSSFSFASSSNYHASDLSGSGSASGGTDDIVQTVNQNDITNAQNKVNTTDATVKQTLDNQLTGLNYYPIDATFSPGTPAVTSSANVGDAATTVTVTETVTYTMMGVQESDLKTLVDHSVKSQIDTGQQSILSEGLGSATFNVNNLAADSAQLAMGTTAEVGPQLNVDQIKQQIVGMKAGDVKNQLSGNPDVTSVDVNFSPFWVNTVPHNLARVTVIVAQPSKTVNTGNQ